MMNVIIHSVLCIYCTVCKKVIQECINPIAAGNFYWIYAVTGFRSEQKQNHCGALVSTCPISGVRSRMTEEIRTSALMLPPDYYLY